MCAPLTLRISGRVVELPPFRHLRQGYLNGQPEGSRAHQVHIRFARLLIRLHKPFYVYNMDMESWREFTEMMMAVLFPVFIIFGMMIGPDVVAGVVSGYIGLLALSVYHD